MIDSHCHLDFKQYDGLRDEVVREANEAGVHTLVNIGVDLATSRLSIELAERFSCVYATVGVHPHDARTLDNTTLAELRRLAAHKKVVAMGEIGLDFYRDLSPRDIQMKVFREQLELAVELKLPIVIHTRNSFEETLKIVDDFAVDLRGGVFHCFPGDVDDAIRVFEIGFLVGLGGITTFPNSRMARVAAEAPLEKIILETDAPFIAPVPHRGKTNRPAYVRFVRDKIAELRRIDPDEVERATDLTCRKLYGLAETFGG
jgi:TatD DNase family protein